MRYKTTTYSIMNSVRVKLGTVVEIMAGFIYGRMFVDNNRNCCIIKYCDNNKML